jgi:hypothetical protein
MKNTTKLKIVGPTKSNPYAPPLSLGKAGASQWRTIMNEYRITDSGGRAVLLQICSATDNLADCDAVIERDGPMIRTKTGSREHPLCKQRLALRAFICRSVQRLGLNLEPSKPVGRPPGPTSPYEDEED